MLVGITVMLLEPGHPETGIRITTDTLDDRVYGLAQLDDVDLAAVDDIVKDAVDVFDQGIQRGPGPRLFLLPVTTVAIGLDAAAFKNLFLMR